MHQRAQWIMGLCAVVIVAAFFLPWISVESGAIGTMSKLLTGKRQATIDAVSGFRVPILANSKDSRFMIDVIKIFNPGVKDADKKSWLIWGVPLFALLLWGIFPTLKDRKWFVIGLGVIGIGIFIAGVYYIVTTDLNKVVLHVKIAAGLWMTLVAYLGMGLTGFWLAFVKQE